MLAATPNRNPPSGPESMPWASVVPAYSRPFARSSNAFGTIAGSIAPLAVRNTTSHALITKSTAYSKAILTSPIEIATASNATAGTRIQSRVIISLRRSTRSASTPPGNEKSSQGSHATANPPETTSGSSVREAISNGAATVARPLPSADVVLAAQSFVYLPSSLSPVMGPT